MCCKTVKLKGSAGRKRFRLMSELLPHPIVICKDLYFRLSVIPLHIPPLKERKEDIPALVERCLAKYAPMLNKPLSSVDTKAMDCMLQYHWPGNVRELENAVEYAVNMASGDSLNQASLPPRIRESQEKEVFRSDIPLKDQVKDFERTVFEEYLEHYGSSYEGKNDIAEKLEISRATLYRKLSELGLSGR